MQAPIYIHQLVTCSAIGSDVQDRLAAYRQARHRFTKDTYWQAPIHKDVQDWLDAAPLHIQNQDRSIQLALYCAAQLRQVPKNAGLNLGSSRGATSVWEQAMAQFSEYNRVPASTSPSTTLGNLSTQIARSLGTDGPALSHSITCSTAGHSILNAIAWLQSGMSDYFIAGGTESCLTDFTQAQMEALRLSSRSNDPYPSRPMDVTKKNNSMILGEGAGLVTLSTTAHRSRKRAPEHNTDIPAQYCLSGYGWGNEHAGSAAGITSEGTALQRSMRIACEVIGTKNIDAIVTHCPGTILGDRAELNAINNVFGREHPPLTNNKWLLGHSFGASMMLSLDMALLMLQEDEVFAVPYLEPPARKSAPLQNILVNSIGFGGNAVSLVVSVLE